MFKSYGVVVRLNAQMMVAHGGSGRPGIRTPASGGPDTRRDRFRKYAGGLGCDARRRAARHPIANGDHQRRLRLLA